MSTFRSSFRFFLFILFFGTQAFSKPIHFIPEKIPLESFEAALASKQPYDFRGIVKLSNCSGSLVRFEGAKTSDKGLILTNGHCVPYGSGGDMIPAGKFIANQPASRSFQFLDQDGTLMPGSVRSNLLIYATVTWNDVALYQLDKTYAEIKQAFHVDPLLISSEHPVQGDSIQVLSGYWQKGYSCKIDRFVYELHEAEYVSKDSMRYSSPGCNTIHGTSGSPVVSLRTRMVLGINSTGNDSGERCTMDNPCEVSRDGEVVFKKGYNYADQTYVIYSCLDSNLKLNLKRSGCQLFKGGAKIK